ncbi:hypothetical protein SEA_CAMERICO_17 [Gordonia phage Camerico]|nr:hypothetical protein SEA_CAMERICO_17 [Gordonia phage Camerico]
MSAYCAASDLMLGPIGIEGDEKPRWLDVDKQIQNAAGEIDSVLGRIYRLPLVIEPDSADAQLLNKLNRFLASGRILMAAASAQEGDSVHQYARYLVSSAEKALQAFADGSMTLENQVPSSSATQDYPSGPDIFLSDKGSFVKDFYGFGEAEFSLAPDAPQPEAEAI